MVCAQMVAMPLKQVIPKLYPSYTQVIPSTNGSNAITATYTRALAKVNMVTSSHMVSSFGMVALLPFVLGCYTLFLIFPRVKEDKNNSSLWRRNHYYLPLTEESAFCAATICAGYIHSLSCYTLFPHVPGKINIILLLRLRGTIGMCTNGSNAITATATSLIPWFLFILSQMNNKKKSLHALTSSYYCSTKE